MLSNAEILAIFLLISGYGGSLIFLPDIFIPGRRVRGVIVTLISVFAVIAGGIILQENL